MLIHMQTSTALLIADFQNDNTDGGPVSVDGTYDILPVINRIRDHYPVVIFLCDAYPPNHSLFHGYGGHLPPHCIVDTWGAEVYSPIIRQSTDYIVHKGTLPKYTSDSGFYNAKVIDKRTRLLPILEAHNITTIHLCGLHYETTIFSTAMDAIRLGLHCDIIEDAMATNNWSTFHQSKTFLQSIGIQFISSQ